MSLNNPSSPAEVKASQLPSWVSVRLNSKKITEFVVVDIETNGLEQRDNQILSIGAVRFINGKVAASFYSLSKPEIKSGGTYTTAESTQINKITEDQVENAPLEKEVMAAFAKFVGTSVIVGHNVVRFDARFLDKALKRHKISSAFGWKLFDTFVIARSLKKFKKNSLEIICKTLGITNRAAHHALADCIATGEVMQNFLDNHYEKVIDSAFITDCQLKAIHLERSPNTSHMLTDEKIVAIGWSSLAMRIEIAQSITDAGGIYLHNTLAGTTKVLKGEVEWEDRLIRKSSSFGSAAGKMHTARTLSKKAGKSIAFDDQDTFIRAFTLPHTKRLLKTDVSIATSSETVHGVDCEQALSILWIEWDQNVERVNAMRQHPSSIELLKSILSPS